MFPVLRDPGRGPSRLISPPRILTFSPLVFLAAHPVDVGQNSVLLSLSPTHWLLTFQEAGGIKGALDLEDQHRFWFRCEHCLAVYFRGSYLASLDLGALADEECIRNQLQ